MKREITTDFVVGAGLIVALVTSIIAGIYTGNGTELQTTIASGLIGFMGRVAMEKSHSDERSGTK